MMNRTGPNSLSCQAMNSDAGRYPEGRGSYATSYSGLLNRDAPEVNNWNYQAAIDLALVLSKAGEKEQANLLLESQLTVHPDPSAPW